jgi:hypothetical protein
MNRRNDACGCGSGKKYKKCGALARKSSVAEERRKQGDALLQTGHFARALVMFDQALAVDPHLVEAHAFRGAALTVLKRYEEALAAYDQALALRPDAGLASRIHADRAQVFSELNRLDDALLACDSEIAVAPADPDGHYNRGTTLNNLNRLPEALEAYGKAIALAPDFAWAHYSQSMCRLRMGDFGRGWEQHEWRWRATEVDRGFPQPLWLGEGKISGKTLLLHAEQGFGDAIQFCRYAPLVADLGARVVLEVPRPLEALLGSVREVESVVVQGQPLPNFDLHCPLMTLPLAFKTAPETIPAHVPYLAATSNRIAGWEAMLGPAAGLRVGLAWSGNSTYKNDWQRSVAVGQLTPLLQLDAELVSLQRELCPDDRRWLASHSRIRHIGAELGDFAETAALISLMDVIITIDTAVAHLAGAMGKQVWVLLPFSAEWRWGLEREDSPWYPTARLFRQPKAGDWPSVVERVVSELRRSSRSRVPLIRASDPSSVLEEPR